MQDTHNFNFFFVAIFVKNNMATLRKFSVTIFYVVTRFTCQRSIGQHMKSIIKLLNVQIALLFSPAFLRENGNGSQIGLGLTG